MNAKHEWRPVAPPPDDVYVRFEPVQFGWAEAHRALGNRLSQAPGLKRFMDRLARRWAIETGVIEGIYELDVKASRRLVKNGLLAAPGLMSSETNKPPGEVLRILCDHKDGLRAARDWAHEGRPLSKWLIRALHTQLLANQHASAAIDQFGRRFDATLVKGEFKKRPNNPTRPDGIVHHFCPPEQVESELDRLIQMTGEADDAHGKR